MGFDADLQKWSINKTEYSIQEVANEFKEFIFDDIYRKYYSEQQDFVQGFLIAGYSSHSDMAEAWKIQIVKDKCFGPEQVLNYEKCGINWFGKTEAVVRLVFGIDPTLEAVLRKNEIREEKVQKIMKSVTNSWSTDLISDPMPIQDAIDLGNFLVELTKSYFRFKPGAAIVGGPTEIAAITKHEGFKWITRKLYYDRELNL